MMYHNNLKSKINLTFKKGPILTDSKNFDLCTVALSLIIISKNVIMFLSGLKIFCGMLFGFLINLSIFSKILQLYLCHCSLEHYVLCTTSSLKQTHRWQKFNITVNSPYSF